MVFVRDGLPLTDSLGLLHGVACSQDVMGFKGHHGLHLQDGGIGQSVVHAVFGSVKKTKQIKKNFFFSYTELA